MRIAIVNLTTKTTHVHNPANILSVLNLPRPRIQTDEDADIVQLGVELTKLGHEVSIYASDAFLPTRSIIHKDLWVRYLPTRLTKLFPYAYYPFTPTLYKHLLMNNYDIVQSAEFFQLGTIIAALAGSNGDFPCLVWHELVHQQQFPGSIVQDAYYKTLGRAIEKKVRAFIPRTIAAREWLVSKGVSTSKITRVVHSAVDRNVFFPLRGAQRLKSKFGVPRDRVLIASVGRLHPYKGMDRVIRAMRLVVDRCPQVSLVIAGEGPEKAYLNQMIAGMDLQEHVRLIGDVSKSVLNDLYNACDFTVLGSRKDMPTPYAAIESLACGKPVLHSFTLLEKEFGGNGYATLCARFGDTRSIAEGMLFLIRNPTVRERMGINALELVCKEYDLAVTARRLSNVYETVLARH